MRQAVQQASNARELLCGCSRQSPGENAQRAEPLGLFRHRQLGSARRCRCPHIGDQVRDREVHLMTDTRDDGRRHGVQRPGDDLLIERPQVLERPAAAREDQ